MLTYERHCTLFEKFQDLSESDPMQRLRYSYRSYSLKKDTIIEILCFKRPEQNHFEHHTSNNCDISSYCNTLLCK